MLKWNCTEATLPGKITAAKRNALRKLVEAYSAVKDLYCMQEMMPETLPECLVTMEHEIHKLRQDLAGA